MIKHKYTLLIEGITDFVVIIINSNLLFDEHFCHD